jgi:hypothetical protein
VQAAGIDAAHAANDDRRLRRRTQHERVELLASRLGVLLGVVEPREGAPLGQRQLFEVEKDGGRDERPCEGPPPRFVGTGYEAPPERPIEREQAPPRTCRASLRGCRSGRGASR